jgi:2-phospho-L-lactate/phosphoenolpyruvate guanylyltransferase
MDPESGYNGLIAVMSIWVIIPVKHLHDSKHRLAHLLSPDERAGLIYQFLERILTVLTHAQAIDHVLVVTGDPVVTALAQEKGAGVLVEAKPKGLNPAVNLGVKRAIAEGAGAVLVLPADLPFVRPDDIESMVNTLTGHGRPLMAISGDELEDGTNALLLAPPGGFTFQYGPGSFQAHLEEAHTRDRTAIIVNAPGLRFDLDTESDWLVYHGYLVQVADE